MPYTTGEDFTLQWVLRQRWIRSTARASRFKSLATIRQQALPKLFGHLLIETWTPIRAACHSQAGGPQSLATPDHQTETLAVRRPTASFQTKAAAQFGTLRAPIFRSYEDPTGWKPQQLETYLETSLNFLLCLVTYAKLGEKS